MSDKKVRYRVHRPRGLRGRKALVALLGLVVAAVLAYAARQPRPPELPPPTAAAPRTSSPTAADPVLDAFRRRRSRPDVQTAGRVERVLRDDEKGSRHERFLIRVADTLTVLVAHNIDVAPRIPLLAGDSVQVRGEYIWDARGGVIHWTHRDPSGKRPGGWVRHEGNTYQ